MISKPLDEKLRALVSSLSPAAVPPAKPHPDNSLRDALRELTEWLLQRRPAGLDEQIRPRHWRWAASRVAMRYAVLGLLAAKRHIPDPGLRWSGWHRAAAELGERGGPLFQPARSDSPSPELRALAMLENLATTLPDPGLPAPTVPKGPLPETAEFLGGLYQELQQLERSGRKRSGSFYTGSALARPTVERTLGPLVQGRCTRDILKLRVCDPAMGAGQFLIAALNYLTDELGDDGADLRGQLATAVLCGVDLDATAVDLGRWALWLEVDDPGLPISALDGQLGVGNSLLGCPASVGCRDRAGADGWIEQHLDAHVSSPFHWPLEFPEVFEAGGFDAVVGNPPWETLQPNSKEFFSELDAEYRSFGKQLALRKQREHLEGDPGSERDWQHLREELRAFSKYAKGRFSWQGSGKLYTYRLFLELSHDLLREGGRLGMIVPSGLYTDLGSAPLRQLFLEKCRWEWLFCFENRTGLFDIDSRYRFGPIVIEKGGSTRSVKTAFLRTDPGDWKKPSPPMIPYTIEQVRRLSPRHGAMLDVRADRDLEVLDKIHRNGKPFLAEAGGDVHFAQGDFNMTSDSALFRERRECEIAGYVPDHHGRWTKGDSVLLPLYQGAMLYDLHPCAAVHARGAGHRTRWRRTDLACVRLGPQYLVDEQIYRDLPPAVRSPQLVLRALSNATNERTVVVGVINDLPCGNSLVILRPKQPDLVRTLFGAGVMSSLIYDWSMRQRMAGTNLNSFILSETVWPEATPEVARRIGVLAAQLALISPRDAPLWLEMRQRGWLPAGVGWAQLLALTSCARLRTHCTLDALVARAFGLDLDDLQWILRDCGHPREQLRNREFKRRLDPKGFWRIDRELEPGERRTVLTLAAFANLREPGELPGAHLDSRLLDWQTCMSPEESWRLCAWHSGQLG